MFFDREVILRSKSDPTLRMIFASRASDTQTPVSIMLVFSHILSDQELAELKSISRIGTYTGHVASVTLPIASLPDLARLDFISRISYPKYMKTELDRSVPEIRADQVWAKVRDSNGNPVNGTGVIIGITDSGIDYAHPDFFFKNGTNKILSIWDQSVNSNPPAGYDYGNECSHYEVQHNLCTELDDGSGGLDAGHGTAVAAVAASSGLASNKFVGVAPGASIVAVKLKDGAENHVLDAVGYLIEKARELDRPLVIDHSIGDNLGSHDGTEPLEIALDDFVQAGTPIVVSAGNERNQDQHVSGRLEPGQSVSVNFALYANQSENDIDLWYPLSDVLSIRIVTPAGEIVSGPTPEAGVSTKGGNVVILTDSRPTGKEWWINITARPGYSLTPSRWFFTLTAESVSSGIWDAWTEPGNFTTNSYSDIGLYKIDPSDTVEAPGNAHNVITVGNYMSKYNWLARCTLCINWAKANGKIGNWYDPIDAPGIPGVPWNTTFCSCVGQLAYSSSSGPTRDGRVKPDITAPGVNIAAARASTVGQWRSDPDNYHKIWRGTSFSAPHVVGVIALMLQMNRYLSPNEIKSILTQDGRTDKFTGQINKVTGSPLWGWGKVDALNSTLDAPKYYSIRLAVAPIPGNAQANVTVDGQYVTTVSLDHANLVTVDFRNDGNHTIDLSPINMQPGVRYFADGTPWTFSSGGVRAIRLHLQYLLTVTSVYGFTKGQGWYDADSTAFASVESTQITVRNSQNSYDMYEFRGWTGAVNSTDTIVQVKMDSSKKLTADWQEVSSYNMSMLPLSVVIIAVILVSILGIYRLRRSKQKTQE